MSARIKKYDKNDIGRDFVIGDLHGCISELEALLETISFDVNKDRLFSVGDLIDRGPRNEDALKLLKEPWFHAVLGNHCEMMYFSLRGKTRTICSKYKDLWEYNGGEWFDKKNFTSQELTEYLDILEQQPHIITVEGVNGRFHVIHAELYADSISISDDNLSSIDFNVDTGCQNSFRDVDSPITWGRDYIRFVNSWKGNGTYFQSDQLSPVYCGHTPMTQITSYLRQINIDTGCCYAYIDRKYTTRNFLSIVEPFPGNIWQCRAKTLEVSFSTIEEAMLTL